MTCPACREQLLEYVYGLVDAEAAAVRTHLETCATCQAEHQKVLRHQLLLGEASKATTAITFIAPKAEPTPVPGKLASSHRASFTVWYTAAAAVLLTVLAGNAGMYWWDREANWRPVELAQSQLRELDLERQRDETAWKSLARVPAEVVTLREEAATLQKDYQAKYEQALAEAKSRAVYFQLVAPTAVEAGRPLNYLVLNKTLDGKPAALPNYQINFIDNRDRQQVGKLISNNANLLFSKLNVNQDPVKDYVANRNYTNEVIPDTQTLAASQPIQLGLEVLRTRYAAHLVTDKPLYQPGEEVHFRGLALDKATLKAPAEDLQFEFTLLNPMQTRLRRWEGQAVLYDEATHQPVRDTKGHPLLGVGAGSYMLPADAPGGEYTLRMTERTGHFADQEVKILVNAGPAPVLDKQLRFTRVSYAPGDEVRLEGTVKSGSGPWAHGMVDAQVEIDGKKYDDRGQPSDRLFRANADANGHLSVRFTLPAQIAEGEATVILKFRLPQGPETWTHPLRIQTREVAADCFPEGGDLVAGVANRVYFFLHNSRGEPVDGQADVVDQSGKVVQHLETFHDDTQAKASRGLGVFTFLPQAGVSYQVRMTRPGAGQIAATLPAALSEGVAMQVDEPVITERSPLKLRLTSVGKDRTLYVLVYCRGQLIALDQCEAKAGRPEAVTTNIPSPLGGVYRVTVCELLLDDASGRLHPLAERLVFGEPGRKLDVRLAAERVNDHRMELKVRTLNEKQLPVTSFMTVAGVHRSVFDLAGDATARKLPAHFLLATEVRRPADLEYADFYLSSHPSARHALDLLLGVQGWRRFAETNLPQVALRANSDVLDNVVYRDNRREVLNAVKDKVTELVGRQNQVVLTRIDALHAAIKHRQDFENQERQRLRDGDAKRKSEFDATTAVLARVGHNWQSFQRWYAFTSAAVVGTLGLISLWVFLLNRGTLPARVLGIVGVSSALSLGGAAYLTYMAITPRPDDAALPQAAAAAQEAVPSHRLQDATGLESAPLGEAANAVPPRRGAAVGSGEGSAKREEIRPAFEAQPLGRAKGLPPGRDAGAKEFKELSSEKVAPPAAKSEPAPALKKADSRPPVAQSLPGLKAAPAAPPAPSLAQDSLSSAPKVQSGTTRSRITAAAPGQATQAQTLNRRQQLDLPLTAPDYSKASPPSRPGRGNEPSGLDRALGGLGGGGAGGIPSDKPGAGPGGAGGRPPGQQLSELPRNAFVAREYNWHAPRLADGIKPAWGQTLYWHPLKVVPHGEVSIPIEVPPGDATYRFDVFGHDGQGRLGAATLEVRTPLPNPRPLAITTRLSTTEAVRGDVIHLVIEVRNQTGQRQPAAEAVIPLPPGLTMPANVKQLRSSTTGPGYDTPFEPTRWTLARNELTLSWNELAAGQAVRVVVDLVCSQSGTLTADKPASAYFVNQKNEASEATRLQIRIVP